MTDREMLELAAKAAWIVIVAPVEHHITQAMHYEGGFIIRNKKGGDSCWNPLTDDGDALRLAVPLGICIRPGGAEVWRDDKQIIDIFDDDEDQARGTRRAIVRAAAKLKNGWRLLLRPRLLQPLHLVLAVLILPDHTSNPRRDNPACRAGDGLKVWAA